MKISVRSIKKIVALVLALALIISTAPVQRSNAAGGSIVVSTQSELNAALKSGKYSKITLRTDAAGTIKIKAGDYGNVSLVVDAPNATIRNNAVAKKVYILGAKKFAEYASGNVISIRAEQTKFVTDENAEVKRLGVAKDDAQVTIENKGSIGKVNVTKSAEIDLKQNGTLDKIYLKAETDLSVTGTSEQQTTLAVYEGAAGSFVEASVGVKAVAYADAAISLGEGAENSSVSVKGGNAEVAVENKTEAEIMITDSEKGVTSVSAGEEAKIKGDDVQTTEPETTPAPTTAPTSTPAPTPEPTPTAPVVDNSGNYSGGGSSSGSTGDSGSSGNSGNSGNSGTTPVEEEKTPADLGKVTHSWEDYLKTGGKDKTLEVNDKAVENAIRTYIGKSEGDILLSDVYELTYLYINSYYDIGKTDGNVTVYDPKDISVLSEMINLQELYIYQAEFSDITVLKNLKELQQLTITNAKINDLSPLKELPYLKRLNLTGFTELDMTVIYELKGLTELTLNNTGFKNIAALAVLPNLQFLSIEGNGITDLSGLDKLEKLNNINVSNNQGIEDFSPIFKKDMVGLGVSNTKFNEYSKLSQFTELKSLSAESNGIKDISWLKTLTKLKSLVLNDNAGIDNFTPISNLNELIVLRLNKCDITDISFLKGLNNLQNLYLENNTITDVSVLLGLENLRFVSLMWNPDAIAGSVSQLRAAKISVNYTSQSQQYYSGKKSWSDYVAEGGQDKKLVFKDERLKIAVEQELDSQNKIRKEDDELWLSDVYELTDLNITGRGITDITPLGEFANLRLLIANNNSITDISPLASLKNLTSLYLIYDSGIKDFSVLKELKNLRILELRGNTNFNDISIITGLSYLTNLGIFSTGITSLEGIEKLTQLRSLNVSSVVNADLDLTPAYALKGLSDFGAVFNSESLSKACDNLPNLNYIRVEAQNSMDLSPLKKLTNLSNIELSAYYEGIQDLSVLGELNNLRGANIIGSAIEDISFVKKLENLSSLMIQNSMVEDISALNGKTSLTSLMIRTSKVKDVSALSGLTNLTSLTLETNFIEDISPLMNLNKLKSLALDSNPISSISCLNSMKPDNKLNISLNSTTVLESEIEEVENVNNMLIISSNFLYPDEEEEDQTIAWHDDKLALAVAEIMFKEGMIDEATGSAIKVKDAYKVIRLDLSGKDIDDIQDLDNFQNLVWLDISNNNIAEIRSLAGYDGHKNLNRLIYIDMSNNKIVEPYYIYCNTRIIGNQRLD